MLLPLKLPPCGSIKSVYLFIFIVPFLCLQSAFKSGNKDSKDSKSSKDKDDKKEAKDMKDVGDGAHVDAVSIFVLTYIT